MEIPADEPSPSLRTRTIKGFGFTASRGILTAVLRVATVAVLARLLTPTEFGVFATVTLLLALASMVLHRGLADAVVQRSNLSSKDAGTAFTLLFVPSLVCSALFWVFAPTIEGFLAVPDLSSALRGLCIAMPIEALGQLYRGDASRHLEFERAALIDVASAVVGSAAIPILLALAGFGYWSLIAGSFAQGLIQLIGFGAGRWRRYVPAFSLASLHRLFAFSALIGIWNIVGYCTQNIERLVLARFMGAEAVGFFSRARSFVGMFVEFYGMPVNQVLFPVLAKLQDDRDRLLKAYRHSVAFSALLSLPSALGVSVLAKPLVAILLGDQWNEVVPLVRIMGPSVFFMIMAMPLVAIVRGTGQLKEIVVLTTVQTVSLIVGSWLLYPYGLTAVAWCTVVVYGVGFFVGNAIIAKKLALPVREFYFPMRPAVTYAAMCAMTWALLEGATPLSTTTFFGGSVFVSACAVELAILVALAPKWFLGDDLWWLTELLAKGQRKLQVALAAARR